MVVSKDSKRVPERERGPAKSAHFQEFLISKIEDLGFFVQCDSLTMNQK